MRRSVLPVFCGLCLSTAALAQTPAALYRPTVITTEWPDYAVPGVMNNVGDITVHTKSDSPNPWREYMRYANGSTLSMGEFVALNDRSQAIGIDFEMVPETYPPQYNFFGTYVNNRTIYPFVSGYRPVALNNSGLIVGINEQQGSVLFDIGTGQTTVMPSLNGDPVLGFDINDSGQVVGSATRPDGTTQAIIFENGQVSALPFGGTSSEATAINASGQILGSYIDEAGAFHRILYDNGSITDLTDILGTNNTLDFNDLGQIRFYRGDVAMIYIDGVAYPIQMVDFDPAKPEFYLVSDLNDQGQLLAMTCPFTWGGPDACDIVRLDFVAVVPEPPAWLMLAGGAMLVSRRLRRASLRGDRV